MKLRWETSLKLGKQKSWQLLPQELAQITLRQAFIYVTLIWQTCWQQGRGSNHQLYRLWPLYATTWATAAAQSHPVHRIIYLIRQNWNEGSLKQTFMFCTVQALWIRKATLKCRIYTVRIVRQKKCPSQVMTALLMWTLGPTLCHAVSRAAVWFPGEGLASSPFLPLDHTDSRDLTVGEKSSERD